MNLSSYSARQQLTSIPPKKKIYLHIYSAFANANRSMAYAFIFKMKINILLHFAPTTKKKEKIFSIIAFKKTKKKRKFFRESATKEQHQFD